jgi:hypothetical protein
VVDGVLGGCRGRDFAPAAMQEESQVECFELKVEGFAQRVGTISGCDPQNFFDGAPFGIGRNENDNCFHADFCK